MIKMYCEICEKPLSNGKRFCSKRCSNYSYARKIKQDVINAYGGKCIYCNITDLDFLCIHHGYFDGDEHRDEVGGGGYNMNLWLKRNKYPKDLGLEVVCHNHNQKLDIEHKKPKKWLNAKDNTL